MFRDDLIKRLKDDSNVIVEITGIEGVGMSHCALLLAKEIDKRV
jgi:hypothetical protein